MLQAGLKAKKRSYKNMYKNMRFRQSQWNYASNQINQINVMFSIRLAISSIRVGVAIKTDNEI